MQRHTLLTLCAAAVVATSALGLATARPANLGSPTNWQGDVSRDWNDGDNWSNGVPHAGDTVNIPSNVPAGYKGDPVLDSGANGLAGDLNITSTRSVTVTGKTLTLNLAVTHDFDGDLFLTDNTAKLVFTADATVAGDGAIVGQDNSAEIRIATDKVLTNTMSTGGIVGNLKIVGETGGTAGKLDNRGAVVANAADGTLELGLNLLLADTAGSGRWEASGQSSSILLFSKAHTCALLGDFRVGDCATIRFDVDIDTKGSLAHDATNNKGTIDMENGATFGYDCDSADPCVCTDITSDTTLGCP